MTLKSSSSQSKLKFSKFGKITYKISTIRENNILRWRKENYSMDGPRTLKSEVETSMKECKNTKLAIIKLFIFFISLFGTTF